MEAAQVGQKQKSEEMLSYEVAISLNDLQSMKLSYYYFCEFTGRKSESLDGNEIENLLALIARLGGLQGENKDWCTIDIHF